MLLVLKICYIVWYLAVACFGFALLNGKIKYTTFAACAGLLWYSTWVTVAVGAVYVGLQFATGAWDITVK